MNSGSLVPSSFSVELPGWALPMLDSRERSYPTLDDRMNLVLDLARTHVAEGTGGPFAAGVFESATGRLIAVGVNLVVPSRACIAHAEVVAFALAGQSLGGFDLSVHGPTELVTTTEPCAMCLGAVAWSGVSHLVCGARDSDARAVGFDEGYKPRRWKHELRRRGIDVTVDVERSAAAAVLRHYVAAGGLIYNGSTASVGVE